MSKLILWGGFGGYNLGDDLILISTIRELEKLGIEGRAFVMGNDLSFIQNSVESNLSLIEDKFRNRINSYKAGYRLVVPGGQVIDDECKYFPYGKLTLDVLLSSLLTKRSPLFLSIGVRPITSKLHKMYAWLHRSRIEKVFARDTIGQSHAKTVYGEKKSLLLLDPVVANKSLWQRSDNPNDEVKGGKALLVLGAEKARHDSGSLMDLVTNFCHEKSGSKLSVLQHDKRFDLDADTIKNSANTLVAVNVVWPKDVKNLLNNYRDHQYIFTNRLHAAILGLINGCLVHLDSNTPKLKSINCMGFELASCKIAGVDFHFLDKSGWAQLQELAIARDNVMRQLLGLNVVV